MIDRTPLIKKYGGKWIAFKHDRITVLAVGDTAIGVLEEARSKGYQDPIITRMPRKIRAFVGGYHLV